MCRMCKLRAAFALHLLCLAAAALPRRLLQTCPSGQVFTNNACYCNPGTRDGTLVNPLMLCNGNNTLCPWRMWRGTVSRETHISGTPWTYRDFNYGVDGNTFSSFMATCSTAAPAKVTINMQRSYRIFRIGFWAGTLAFALLSRTNNSQHMGCLQIWKSAWGIPSAT